MCSHTSTVSSGLVAVGDRGIGVWVFVISSLPFLSTSQAHPLPNCVTPAFFNSSANFS